MERPKGKINEEKLEKELENVRELAEGNIEVTNVDERRGAIAALGAVKIAIENSREDG